MTHNRVQYEKAIGCSPALHRRKTHGPRNDDPSVTTLPSATRRAPCTRGHKPRIKPGRGNEDSGQMSFSANPSAGRVS